MSMALDQITEEAMKLSPDSKALLADKNDFHPEARLKCWEAAAATGFNFLD
jgi:hypothetical protein